MSKYVLAVEFEKCDDKENSFCIERLRNKKQCEQALSKCSFPIRANPLCFCDSRSSCPAHYHIINKNSKIYIFYQCIGCSYFSKGDDNTKILDMINSPSIYYNKSLDKLITKLDLKEITPKIELDSLIQFFEGIFVVLDTRLGENEQHI